MSICDACMKNPIHPDMKCCFNCGRDGDQCEVWHNCGEDCPAWEGKVKTNTDRIRAMSDDDLARILYDRPWCHHHCEHTGEDECLDCIARYLQRPANEVQCMSLTAVYNYPNNGWCPACHLEVGKEYPVERVNMGQSSTSIQLFGFTGMFSSVQFDFFEDGKPIDIYSSPKYNPYLRRRTTE